MIERPARAVRPVTNHRGSRWNRSSTCSGCAPAHATDHTRDGIGRRTFLAQSALLAAGRVVGGLCRGRRDCSGHDHRLDDRHQGERLSGARLGGRYRARQHLRQPDGDRAHRRRELRHAVAHLPTSGEHHQPERLRLPLPRPWRPIQRDGPVAGRRAHARTCGPTAPRTTRQPGRSRSVDLSKRKGCIQRCTLCIRATVAARPTLQPACASKYEEGRA